MLKEGLEFKLKSKVTNLNTAKEMKSGGLLVYATPAMVALMEQAAYESVQPYMEDGKTTVGIFMNVKHISASPVDMELSCKSKLCKIDGRKLSFVIEAYDSCGLIGTAEHDRFIVDAAGFQKKTDGKAGNIDG